MVAYLNTPTGHVDGVSDAYRQVDSDDGRPLVRLQPSGKPGNGDLDLIDALSGADR